MAGFLVALLAALPLWAGLLIGATTTPANGVTTTLIAYGVLFGWLVVSDEGKTR